MLSKNQIDQLETLKANAEHFWTDGFKVANLVDELIVKKYKKLPKPKLKELEEKFTSIALLGEEAASLIETILDKP